MPARQSWTRMRGFGLVRRSNDLHRNYFRRHRVAPEHRSPRRLAADSFKRGAACGGSANDTPAPTAEQWFIQITGTTGACLRAFKEREGVAESEQIRRAI